MLASVTSHALTSMPAMGRAAKHRKDLRETLILHFNDTSSGTQRCETVTSNKGGKSIRYNKHTVEQCHMHGSL